MRGSSLSFKLVAACSVLLLAVYFGRGMLGGGERLAAVLAVNALFLGSSWWLRRAE